MRGQADTAPTQHTHTRACGLFELFAAVRCCVVGSVEARDERCRYAAKASLVALQAACGDRGVPEVACRFLASVTCALTPASSTKQASAWGHPRLLPLVPCGNHIRRWTLALRCAIQACGCPKSTPCQVRIKRLSVVQLAGATDTALTRRLFQFPSELVPGTTVAFDDLVFDVEFEFERECYRMLA
jgi:hypothetical protein